jgi:hypothetical protein
MPRRAAPLVALGLALAAALGAGGCDWREFDDLKLQTPIRAVIRPTDMDSNVYPSAVLAVARPRGNAELLVLGADNVALADFTFGEQGQVGTQTVSHKRFLLNGAEVGALAVAAYLPGSDDTPRIAAVMEEERQPVIIALDSADTEFAVTALGAPLAIEAGALAVGDARGLGSTDVVLTSGKQLVVYPEARADAVQTCDLTSAVSTLAVGDGWVVAGHPAAPGNVWLIPTPSPDGDGACQNVTPLGDYTESLGFGAAVVVADVDGNGTRDIAVAAPQERSIYFYSSPSDPVPLGHLSTKTFAGASTGCGTAFTVAVVEGKRTLVVGDPGDPGDVAAPGSVWLYDLEGRQDLTALTPPTEEVRRFGAQVGVVEFTGRNGEVNLIWVTAESATQGDPGVVYLYFWVHDAASDPRPF